MALAQGTASREYYTKNDYRCCPKNDQRCGFLRSIGAAPLDICFAHQ